MVEQEGAGEGVRGGTLPDLSLAYAILYVADLPLMARFYGETLGLPIASRDDRFVAFGGAVAPLALEAGGPMLGAARGKEQNPTLWQFAVADIDAGVAALAARSPFSATRRAIVSPSWSARHSIVVLLSACAAPSPVSSRPDVTALAPGVLDRSASRLRESVRWR